MDVDADLTAILADAAALGLADAAVYTPVGGAPVALTVSCQDAPQATFADIGGQTLRRQALVLLQGADIAAPAQDDGLTIATGPFAGAWVVVDVGMRDLACRLITVRFDDRIKAQVGGVERDPNA